MKTAKFFPRPAELIAIASEITDERIRSGQLQLPPQTPVISVAERIESHKRIIAGFEKLGVKNQHEPRIVVELNREAAAAGIPGIDITKLPGWMQEKIANYLQERAA